MTHHSHYARFKAPGQATNYEMAGLREDGLWRDMRWIHVWSSLSDAKHPRSQEEWNAMLDETRDI